MEKKKNEALYNYEVILKKNSVYNFRLLYLHLTVRNFRSPSQILLINGKQIYRNSRN